MRRVKQMALNDGMNGFDAERAQYDRMNRTNPPEYAPGQSDDFFNDSIFSNDVSQPTGSTGGMFSDAFNTAGGSVFNQQVQQTQPPKDDSDRFWEMVDNAKPKVAGFFKEFGTSFGKVTPYFWSDWGYKTLIVSTCVFGAGILLRLFGVRVGMKIAIGSLISAIPSVICWLFLQESARKCSSMYKEDNSERVMENQVEDDPFGMSGDSDPFGGFGEEPSTGDDLDFFGEDSSSDDSDDDLFGDDDFDFDDFETESPTKIESVDTESAIETLPEVDKGMYTRQYLYEQFTKVMPSYNADFYKNKGYSEDDDVFLYWEENLRQATQVTGVSEDLLPNLMSLKENLFVVELECERPKGFKPDAVAKELASIYSFNEGMQDTVAFDVKPVGMSCFIRLFKGENAMISLRDMYQQVENFMLDTNNYMPVVIGNDYEGKVLAVDLKKVESMLIAGMPRSGKTWEVLALIYQMASFCSPKELNFYILDPKAGISDYRTVKIPHVKYFEQSYDKVIPFLRDIVHKEASRRKKLLGDHDCVKIWDFKKKYPDYELPIIYVVIDEMVSFSGNLDKEQRSEFRSLLRELVSQLPALGIRAIFIPHVVKNEFIEKTTSDLIMCRVSVRGEPEHIESSIGAKPKDFPWKLTNLGDMGVLLKEVNPSAIYVKAPVLTATSDETANLFDYQRRVWAKLEPESVRDSVAFDADFDKEQQELLERLQADDSIDDNEIF